MKLGHRLDEYRKLAIDFLNTIELSPEDIRYGWAAWNIASTCGITKDAYGQGRDVYDAHIQTVLERIFPNAIFCSDKRY